jgi:multiple sugar transport system substrate-binding protein
LNNPVIQSFAEIASDISGGFNNLQAFGSVDGKNFLIMGEVTSTGVISNAVNRVTVKGEDPAKVAKEAHAEIEALLK